MEWVGLRTLGSQPTMPAQKSPRSLCSTLLRGVCLCYIMVYKVTKCVQK